MTRRLCKTHPDVDYKHEWGCPECVSELRKENAELQEKFGKIINICTQVRLAPRDTIRDVMKIEEIAKRALSDQEDKCHTQ